MILMLGVVACEQVYELDYNNETELEKALNSGEDVVGKIVSIKVEELVPNSTFGYNIQTGEHLNFCSSKNPNVEVGDIITVKIVDVSSMLGSYIIGYEKLK